MTQQYVHSENSPADIPDLYPSVFDVVVIGAGYCGLGAALSGASSAERVLVVESSGQLLWESTSALEIDLPESSTGEAWQAWLSEVANGHGVSPGSLDMVAAEILAARKLSENPDHLQALLYAVPVAVQQEAGELAVVVFATKEGFRRVRARRWVDASESGQLLCLVDPDAQALRTPERSLNRLVLQSDRWPAWDSDFGKYARERGMEWRAGVRSCERQLVWEDDGASWHSALLTQVQELRKAMQCRPLVSHSSSMSFPVYAEGADCSVCLRDNLIVLSPVFTGCRLGCLSERFEWGYGAVQESFADLPRWQGQDLPAITSREIAVGREQRCDVLVAGVGTAGSLAALSAGASGARTCALEFAPFPGGIGTGGGITSYFYGLPGGRQEDVGKQTAELTELLYGDSYEQGRNYWHQDAKKIVILSEFDRHGISFCGNSLLCGVEKSGQTVTAVLAAIDGQLVRYGAKSFIDSTGDGDLCAHAGAGYTGGRAGDNRTLAYSVTAFTLDTTVPDLRINIRNFDAGWLDATSARDLSRARLKGLIQYDGQEWAEDKRPLYFAPLLGVRESRHIVTDYTLKMDDLITQREFEDAIGWAGSHADTHSVDFEFEDDETVFFYWVCRLFRYQLRTQLPYRMLLPVGLDNVWIACRAAGMNSNVFYGIRMQRDMQRLGEVAGVAAAMATASAAGGGSREVPMAQMQQRLNPVSEPPENASEPGQGDPLEVLKRGETGTALWMIYRRPDEYREQVAGLLVAPGKASFFAACILAMWEDERAEARLLEALASREDGELDPSENVGAYGQEIDIPFWLLAVILLRRCGSERCVPSLVELSGHSENILNVRSAVALTVERLVDRHCVDTLEALKLVELLARPLPDHELTPSHSIARRLRNEEQMVLKNHYMEPVREDHAWQLHLVLCRIRLKLGVEPHAAALRYLKDGRMFVQQAFAQLMEHAPVEC